VKGGDEQIDGLDADEGRDHPAEAVDQKVAAEQLACADGPGAR
jgi:hypothetical protein